MNNLHSVLLVAVTAAVTIAIRLVPLTLIRGEIKNCFFFTPLYFAIMERP